ncbi:alcohol dehydrogenase catalytic domain-containing protein [Oceanobacillus sojae]|uniref:Alcohol dehydrogenase n=1 Tax=Oceanobacillus sojae TaxID=582851 RepID=A0A511ZFW1_9BACI|nr:alcohol dehydrogenase catalytic domain-containing protein [Oceanobacillus sojae]GEN86310.1 alcohol dehydrogenase [Oceanobacillus sojae]
MKASVFYGKNDIRFEEVDKPDISDKEILIQMKACGLCGTDIHKITEELVPAGSVLGHEYAGEVVAVGKEVSEFRPGDRVTGGIHVPCFTCEQCSRGHYTLCPEFKKTNIHPGGFAEYIKLPEEHVKHLLYKIPDGMSYSKASLAEPVACCIHGQKAVGIHAGDRVLVMGAGPIGLIHSQLLKNKLVKEVVITDVSDHRLNHAHEFGADVTINAAEKNLETYLEEQNHPGFNVIIIAAGVSALLPQAMNVLKRGGTVICFSPFTMKPSVEIDASMFFHDEKSIVGTYSVSPYEFEEAILAIQKGVINTEALITHVMPLSNLGKAIELTQEKTENVLKIVLKNE